MRFYSICFLFTEICQVRKWNFRSFQDHCQRWYNASPVCVMKYSRVVTLVEAESEEGAIQIRKQSHPELFENSIVDIMEFASPEEWSSMPDCTFKFFPPALVAELEYGTKLFLDMVPAATHAFEDARWHGGIHWQAAA